MVLRLACAHQRQLPLVAGVEDLVAGPDEGNEPPHGYAEHLRWQQRGRARIHDIIFLLFLKYNTIYTSSYKTSSLFAFILRRISVFANLAEHPDEHGAPCDHLQYRVPRYIHGERPEICVKEAIL